VNTVGAGALSGRRIVITRAPEQAEELVDRLVEAGAEIRMLPMVRFVEASDPSALDRAIAELARFDWLIFTSGNAVRFFLGRCRFLGRWPLRPGLRYAAVGLATREALKEQGLHEAFMPRQASAASLGSELAAELNGKSVLIPRSDRAADDLPSALRAAGAIVTDVVAYCTAAPESFDDAVIATLRRGDADAVAFFSPSAVDQFARLLGTEGLLQLRGRVAFAAIGPTTAAAIREAGAPVSVEAPAATTDSLVGELERYFTRQAARKERV
jgi:uroporphyrinogen-III synthase